MPPPWPPLPCRMSSSLEVQGSKPYSTDPGRFGEEAQGLVESGQGSGPAAGQTAKPSYQDDEGILPVILEDYLERAGVMCVGT